MRHLKVMPVASTNGATNMGLVDWVLYWDGEYDTPLAIVNSVDIEDLIEKYNDLKKRLKKGKV